jgi:hypothetical protein
MDLTIKLIQAGSPLMMNKRLWYEGSCKASLDQFDTKNHILARVHSRDWVSPGSNPSLTGDAHIKTPRVKFGNLPAPSTDAPGSQKRGHRVRYGLLNPVKIPGGTIGPTEEIHWMLF